MEKKGLAVCISNAAVLVCYEEIKILIDGLYCDDTGYFSQLPVRAWEEMRSGLGELSNIDYLLFTHAHPDHFHLPYLNEYIKRNDVKGFCLPQSVQAETDFCSAKSLCFDKGRERISNEMILRCIDIRHMDKQFYHILNRCFILEAGEKRLLFLGDADYREDDYINIGMVDIVFVTPFFYNHPKGRKIIKELLCPEKVVIYHMPFPEDDKMSFEKMAKRDIMKYADEKETVIVWNKMGQSFLF